jgi:UDP-2,4-diacetamido-2,4,6-trideoxy-beta-L-altropyranose hydrolase
MEPKIIIRADGNNQIGLGHLVRCLALGSMLQADWSIRFVCLAVPDKIATQIEALGFSLKIIASEQEFFELITPSDVIILDGYHFDTAYQKTIKSSGNTLVCIDDLHDKEYYADLIINHAPSVVKSDYSAQPYTQYALGSDYALLRPSFLKAARQPAITKPVETVLICFGGSDVKNFTALAFTEAVKEARFKKIIVVTGQAYAYSGVFSDLAEQDGRVAYHHGIEEEAMLALMQSADVAIVPASGVLLEVLAAGCLAISGAYIENQKFIYQQYKEKGSIIDAGDFSQESVRNAILSCFEHRQSAVKHIDGMSGERIRKVFRRLYILHQLQLRTVTASDLEKTYTWATNDIVRAFSFQKHEISYEEHSRWFKAKIDDEHCFFYIAELNGDAIGSIRFDVRGGEALISYLLDPAFHGKGLGKIILDKGAEAFYTTVREQQLPIEKIVGYVEAGNIPSVKVFEGLHYEKLSEQDKFRFEKKIAL